MYSAPHRTAGTRNPFSIMTLGRFSRAKRIESKTMLYHVHDSRWVASLIRLDVGVKMGCLPQSD